jgi:hypothetical protein
MTKPTTAMTKHLMQTTTENPPVRAVLTESLPMKGK